jgi:hypothetical protein
MPTLEEQQKDFMLWMGRHLVALVANFEEYDNAGNVIKKGFCCYSAFVMRVFDRHFLVTAGHCIEDFEDEYLKKPHIHVWGVSLMDYFGTNAVHDRPVPFPYEVGDSWKLFRKDLQIDFAVVPLSDLLCANLAANGVKVVTREMWINPEQHTYTHYKILGLPSHLIEPMPSGNWGVRPTSVAFEKIDHSQSPVPIGKDWFLGKIISGYDEIKSIVGMSGGPIYGFWQSDDERWHYHIIALQSCWREDHRITCGYPLETFAEFLHERIAAMAAEKCGKPCPSSGCRNPCCRPVGHAGGCYCEEHAACN